MASSVGSRLPGIEVEIVADAGLIQPIGTERFPAIIGIGDKEIVSRVNFLVKRGTGTDDDLPEKVESLFQIGKAPGITQYSTIAGDFEIVSKLDADGDPISSIRWLGTAGNPSQPAAGQNYYVSWTIAMPSSAFTSQLYLDEQEMLRELGGESMFSANTLINPLVAAARLALRQGAPGVYVTQLDFRGEHSSIVPSASSGWVNPLDPTGGELDVAYEAAVYELDKVEMFKLFVCPLDPASYPDSIDPTHRRSMAEDNNARWFVHVNIASAPDEGRERTLFGVMPQGTVLETLLDTATAYRQTSSPQTGISGGARFALPASKGETPDEACSVQITVNSRVGNVVPLGYLSAATAGVLCANEIGAPNNSAPIGGVTLLGNWTLPEARILRGGGVMPFKTRQGLTTLLMPITVDTTSAFTEDLSVQDIADYLRAFVRIRLFDLYRNTKITSSTTGAIEASVRSLLDGLVANNILVSYDPASIKAVQRKDEPRLIELRGTVKPAFPLRFINAKFVFTAAI